MTASTSDILRDKVRHALQAQDVGDAASELAINADLYKAGLTSLALVELVLALEQDLDIAFPEHLLTRHTFASIASITQACQRLIDERHRDDGA